LQGERHKRASAEKYGKGIKSGGEKIEAQGKRTLEKKKPAINHYGNGKTKKRKKKRKPTGLQVTPKKKSGEKGRLPWANLLSKKGEKLRPGYLVKKSGRGNTRI